MSDFYEIDFLNVETAKSGDAIPLRYQVNGEVVIHMVDGGFQSTGDKIVEHINKYYGNPTFINRLVVTHPDGDHAGGLRSVLEQFEVGELWMLRPWLYAQELLPRFSRLTSVENLKKRLKEIYPNIAALEEIANTKGVVIRESFQGEIIGAFTVMAPTRERYLDLVVASERTPESVRDVQETSFGGFLEKAATAVVAFLRAAWGEETFSEDETSAENEMSVIQFADLCGDRILLTGDAGRSAMTEAANFAPSIGLELPGIKRFQVPHHGSRRNVSTDLLDQWLGSRLGEKPEPGQGTFSAMISAAKEDKNHPRKAVVRALIHRGATVSTNEGGCVQYGRNAPQRSGWGPVAPLDYPEEHEE